MEHNASTAPGRPGQAQEAERACRILIADGDIEHCARARDALEDQGASLHLVSSAEALVQQLATAAPDVVLLDPGFADGQALALYRDHCQEPRPGLVVCTSDRCADMRVACAEAGADHLVYKPVLAEEIPLLIGNLLYRLNGEREIDRWSLDSLRWVLHTPQGRQVSLTYREMLILDALSHSPGRVIVRDVMIQALGFNPADYDVRRLEILVRRLRTKVSNETGLPLPITTVHGAGYAFTAPIRLVG